MPWAPSYVTDVELKAYLRIDDAVDDAQVVSAAAAASRAVDFATGRQFGQVAAPEARLYSVVPMSQGRSYVTIDDLQDVTGLVVRYSNTYVTPVYDQTVTAYTLWPWNAADEGRPYTRLVNLHGFPMGRFPIVEVTGRWGWSSVPTTIKEATLLQAARFFHRRNAPFGVAGSPEVGSELRLLERLDPDVAVMVKTYTRHWGAV